MSVYQFTIGDINCAVLQEGAAQMTLNDIAGRYPNASRAEIEAALGGQAPAGSLNLLYVERGGIRLLADVGFGAAGPPGMGGALRGLASLGLSAADIDLIYLTHFHGDHIAGLVDADGDLAYPNARYVTTQAEWDEWIARWAASSSAADQQTLERFRALRDDVAFVADGDAVLPGVTAVNLEGHTLGHSGLLVESEGERLLHVVDLLHQPFQFEQVDWHFGFDSDGALAAMTRRRVLQECADSGILTLFYHLPFPGLGTVSEVDGRFTWQPLG